MRLGFWKLQLAGTTLGQFGNRQATRMVQPETVEMQLEVSRILGLEVQNECLPGVQASLQLLETHAAVLKRYTSELSEETKNELQQCSGAR
jgi:hypothetical protein